MKATALKRNRYLGLAAAGVLALVIGLVPILGKSSNKQIEEANKAAATASTQAQQATKQAQQATTTSQQAQQQSNQLQGGTTESTSSDEPVTGADIADGSITASDLAAGVGQGSAPASTPAPVVTQPAAPVSPAPTQQTVKVLDNSVSGKAIANRSIRRADIAKGAINGDVIRDGAITSDKVADNAITGEAIANDAVHGSDVAAGAVTGAKLAQDSVTSSKIADGVVGSADIHDGSVDSQDVASDAIGSSKILDGAVKITDLSQSVFASANSAGSMTSRAAASADNEGFFYFATDDNGGTLYRSDGKQWVKVSPGLNELGSGTTTSQPLTSSVELVNSSGNTTWTNQPAAVTEFNNSPRWQTRYDAAAATQARINVPVMTAGAAGAALSIEYSTDGTSWQALGSSGSNPTVDIASTGLKTSSWGALDAGAKSDVILRVVGAGGDGATDPSFGRIDVQFKQ